MLRRLLPACVLLAAFAGCVYVPPVAQGNVLKQDDLKQLKVGMTPDQVRYLFGKPALANPFETNVWRYVYYYKPNAGSKAKIYRLTVYFENGKVARFTTSAPISAAPT